MHNPTEPEYVVLADTDGQPAGKALKSEIHSENTPLHFAFSAFVLDTDGKFLMTRRALSKLTWPGVWTNSFCGHPGPGESTEDAVRRRAAQELGLADDGSDIASIELVLPDFRYRAVDSSGIVEHEICPVFVVRLVEGAQLAPQPDEVDSHAWADPRAVISAIQAAPFLFSPWMVDELQDETLRQKLV